MVYNPRCIAIKSSSPVKGMHLCRGAIRRVRYSLSDKSDKSDVLPKYTKL